MAVPASHEAPNARYQVRLGPSGSLVGRAPVYDRGDQCPYLLNSARPAIGNRTLGLFSEKEGQRRFRPRVVVFLSHTPCAGSPARFAAMRGPRPIRAKT